MGYPKRDNACELNSYGHEQYPFDSPNQNNWAHGVCRLPQQGYCFLYRFWYGYAIPFQVSINMWWNPRDFWYTLWKVIAHALSNYGHMKYPYNNLDQNDSVHGVYKIPSWVYCFLSRFWYGYAIPLYNSIDMLWSPNRSIAQALSNNFGHEQYPSDTMYQKKNFAHGVYKIPS